MSSKKFQQKAVPGTSSSSSSSSAQEDLNKEIKIRIQDVNRALARCESLLKKIKTTMLIATASGQHQGLACYMAAARLEQLLERIRKLLGEAINAALEKGEKDCQEMEDVTQEINGLQQALELWNLKCSPEEKEDESKVPK